MSEAFGRSPPVYANTGGNVHPTSTSLPSSSSRPTQPQGTISQEIYRESIQSAVLDKVRVRLDETIQIGNVEIESLRKTEQDLTEGEKKLQTLINDAQQQQIQAQVYYFIFMFFFFI